MNDLEKLKIAIDDFSEKIIYALNNQEKYKWNNRDIRDTIESEKLEVSVEIYVV